MYNAPMERLLEPIIGIILGFLTFLLAELRRRRKSKSSAGESAPPPVNNVHCKQCFFFREHKRWLRMVRRRPVRLRLTGGGGMEDRGELDGERSQSAKGVNE